MFPYAKNVQRVMMQEQKPVQPIFEEGGACMLFTAPMRAGG